MKVWVEGERCEGHGMCVNVAPDVYGLDDDGLVEILYDDVPDDIAGHAEEGALACPVAALRTR